MAHLGMKGRCGSYAATHLGTTAAQGATTDLARVAKGLWGGEEERENKEKPKPRSSTKLENENSNPNPGIGCYII